MPGLCGYPAGRANVRHRRQARTRPGRHRCACRCNARSKRGGACRGKRGERCLSEASGAMTAATPCGAPRPDGIRAFSALCPSSDPTPTSPANGTSPRAQLTSAAGTSKTSSSYTCITMRSLICEQSALSTRWSGGRRRPCVPRAWAWLVWARPVPASRVAGTRRMASLASAAVGGLACCWPALAFSMTGANWHDSVVFEDLVDTLPLVHGRIGKPRRWPDMLHADKGHDCKRCRVHATASDPWLTSARWPAPFSC